MKKYLLKLINDDIKEIERLIICWHRDLKKVSDIEYATNKYKSLNKRLSVAINNKKRLEKMDF